MSPIGPGLIFWLSLITIANCGCIESDVSMQFRNEIVPNNSYVLFSRIQQYLEGRLYCNTISPDCCNDTAGDWYLPNGERILGGYEYSNTTNKFIRSRDRIFHNIGLYRFFNPPERGRFWCELPDTNGTNCTLFVNIVNDIPAIISQPISQAVIKEENVTFSVNVSNNEFAAYQWQKDIININDDDPGNYHGTRSPSLTIINAQEEDEGYYQCVVDNFLVSDSAELSVVNAPRVVKMSADVNELTITSGDDIDFSFNSTWLTNANFHWQKNGVNITTGNKYRGTTTDTLTLLNATEGDEGTYTLVVNIDGHNSWLNVTVSTAVVTVEIYTLFEPEIGLQYNMSCIVTGAEQLNPNISYQWYKDEELFFGENQSHWTRQSLRHDDAGDYKCVVNISSNVLGRGHVTKASEAFRLCIPYTSVNLSQEELNNNSFIYYDQISQQGTSRALACHINNCNYSDEGGIPQGHWYFPNGEIVPFKTQGSLFSVVVERKEGELLLQWLGHPSQTGRYFCKGPKFNSKSFYIHIGSRVTLSLRGITVYNNSYINVNDIGGNTDREALLCHTENTNCCGTQGGRALGEWHYPNGSAVNSIVDNDSSRGINGSYNNYFLASMSQTTLRLFRGGAPTERGCFCCIVYKSDDQGSDQTLCVNLVDNPRLLSSTQLHENYCINAHGINNTGQEPVIVQSNSSSNSSSDALIWGLLSSTIFLLLLLFTFVIVISTLLIIRSSRKEKASMVVSKQTSVTVEENEIYAEIGTARADKQDSVELNTESTQTKENTYEYMYTEDDYEEMTTLT